MYEEPTENIISTNGTHKLNVKMEHGNWKTIIYHGEILGITNPVVGRVVTTPWGDMIKIVRIGSDYNHAFAGGKVVKAVWAVEWDGK